MPMTDPIKMIKDDRSQARRLEDTNADICFLALADSDGNASVRTLVLRDIHDNRFLLFLNQSSPKWRILTGGGSYQLLLWYHSMQRQYRISGTMAVLDTELVAQNWQRRPRGSKYLDLYYENVADQSSVIDSRNDLVQEINRIKEAYKLEGVEAPRKVAGVELIADHIEMLDLNREDRIHDRRVYTHNRGAWSQKTLVP